MFNLKTTIKNSGIKISIFKPEICPFCERGIDPIVLNNFFVDGVSGSIIYVAMKCPVCGEVFFCKYLLGASLIEANFSNMTYHFSQIYGGEAQKQSFSDEIKELSSRFVAIFNQAYEAEQKGLNEIDGMGYRKAFEVLIKDYAIWAKPENSNKICEQKLSQCLSLIFSEEEKQIFEKTSWIGNDHTHYTKKHDEYDVSDLKKMIMLCVSRIEAKIRETNYLKSFK